MKKKKEEELSWLAIKFDGKLTLCGAILPLLCKRHYSEGKGLSTALSMSFL
jgi:hypothetical protein